MAQVIKPKRKFTAGAPTTSDLVEGEIAINTADKKLYIRDNANNICLLYTSPSPRDRQKSRMPSSA